MSKIIQIVSLTMPRLLFSFPLVILFFSFVGVAQDNAATFPVYNQLDLGLTRTKDAFTIKVWAPLADSVQVLFTKEVPAVDSIVLAMKSGTQGVWSITFSEESNYHYYLIRAKNKKQGTASTWSKWVTDPYSIAVSVNGNFSAILDLATTNPKNWYKAQQPKNNASHPVIIYELNIRDASMHISSGIKQKGKYLGLTEFGSKNSSGLKTGLDHIKEMGVTHVHLLPFFDFKSSDESVSSPPYNWGYDPFHYNAPEGIFASENKNPATRIIELKKMIQTFHDNGLKIVMDVVYNHTALLQNSSFEQLVPGYYFRKDASGNYSNASGCGNETASEQVMFKNFMLQSLTHWVKEYQVDGFRFDLMGVHDIATMNLLADSLRAISPSILLYGEGWTAGASPLPDSIRALKSNVAQLKGISVFGDEFRDGLKGSVFEPKQRGYVSGELSNISSILFGLVGGISHPAVNYNLVRYTHQPIATSPNQLIAYADCHDNHTLADKLSIANPGRSLSTIKEMQKLAFTLLLTSQSPSFIHAGSEFMRSKGGVENSFESPDSINAIDWNLKTTHMDLVEYVKKLIKIKKEHPTFNLPDPANQVQFYTDSILGVIGYFLDASSTPDQWKKTQVWFNPSEKPFKVDPSLANKNGLLVLHLIMKNNEFLPKPISIQKGEYLLLQPHSSLIVAAW